MAKFSFHFVSPWRIVKRILISLIPFLFLTACSGGPFFTEFGGSSFSGESGPSGPSTTPPPACGPEGPNDPEAAGFLCKIITSAGSFDPSFDPDETTYTLALPFSTLATYTLSSFSGDLSFTLTLNGNPINSGDLVELTAPAPGLSSLVTIRVRDTNGNETVYEITVNRTGPPPCGPEGPNDPAAAGFLCDLIASSGTLSPSFDPDDITYTLTLPFLTPSTYTMTSFSGDPSFTLTLDLTPVNSGDPVQLTAPDPGGSSLVRIRVRDTNGNETVYEITVNRQSANNFAQGAYLKASNTGQSDFFAGSSPPGTGTINSINGGIAISGDTIVVGALGEASAGKGVDPGSFSGPGQSDNSASLAGAAYVFVRDEFGIWTQQAYLKASNTEVAFIGDLFGQSVAISGDTIVVGATHESSDAAGVDTDPTGMSAAQTNNDASRSGAAYVFVRSGTTWTQQAYLKASNSGKEVIIPGILEVLFFGWSVAISGDTIVVGTPDENSARVGVFQPGPSPIPPPAGPPPPAFYSGLSGAAYVFVRDGSGFWSQQAYLKASNNELNGFLDSFGEDVAISGDTIVVGAQWEDSNAKGVNGDEDDDPSSFNNTGAAYVFFRSGTTWTQQAYLKASNTGAGDRFGENVGISGNTIVVASLFEDSGVAGVDTDPTGTSAAQTNNSAFNSGAAYVFFRSGTTWSQQAYLKASNVEAGDQFTNSQIFSGLAISGDSIVMGVSGEDSNATGVNGDETDDPSTFNDSGAAYVFVRSGSTWTQEAYLKASNTQGPVGISPGDAFGFALDISGGTIVVGTPFESSAGKGVDPGSFSGPDQSDNSAISSGAAYVFQ